MNAYAKAICDAMSLVCEHPLAIVIGQAVVADGTAMSQTFRHLPPEKLLEMPVAENLQCGMATGIAIAGGLPVSVYPRIQFLLEAVPQMVQQLDKIPIFSNGGYKPRVIIRTAVATPIPLDAGCQHLGDPSGAFEMMFKTIRVERLAVHELIVPAYRKALDYEGSTLLVEYTQFYA
jgi:pyruvate/2-oxoglutarate/acetoin dehydrogenase E1 component